jgi:monoamine oxidase
MPVDAIVVGAGVSGLACAATLRAAGARVVVFEARDRVGGRVQTFEPPDGGTPIELGAQVVHGARNAVRELVATRAVPRDTRAHVVSDGRTRDMALLARGRHAPWRLEAAVPRTEKPASVGAWLRGLELDDLELRAARSWFAQNWALDSDLLDAAGVADARRGDDVGDGEFAVDGGFAGLPAQLAADLDIRLSSPAREVRWSTGRVEILGERASAVVLTVPPPTVGRALRVDNLPADKAVAARELKLGDACCAVVTLSRPAPASTVVFDVDGGFGFVRCYAERPYVLIVAKAAAASIVRAALRTPRELAARLAVALPWTAGASITAVRCVDWGRDPWATGAFSSPRVGAVGAATAWARPLADTVFFAGEATVSGRRMPFVQGAMASGVRAAGQVLAASGGGAR